MTLRHSKILADAIKGYYVELYKDNQLIRMVECYGKSIHYATDVAARWDAGELN